MWQHVDALTDVLGHPAVGPLGNIIFKTSASAGYALKCPKKATQASGDIKIFRKCPAGFR
jgi:hypothetical protein